MDNLLTSIPRIGPKTILKLNRLGLNTTNDLLWHLPYRYLDFSHHLSISQAQPQENVTVKGKVVSFNNIYTRFHKNIQKAVVTDTTATLNLIWFNQPYLSKIIKVGQIYSFAGPVSLYQGRKTIIAPEHGQYHTGKIIPIYPEARGLTSKWFRSAIQSRLSFLTSSVRDPLPVSLIHKYALIDLATALYQLHSPQDPHQLNRARQRLALHEILSLQATSYQQKQKWNQKKPNKVFVYRPEFQKIIEKFISRLPFKLTLAQNRVWQETLTDLTQPLTPSNRLIQGDVGSGKTVIALLASLLAHLNHSQTVFIVPTEILAQQHYRTFSLLLKPLKIKTTLLTSSVGVSDRKLKTASIIISTHAIFYKNKKLLANLGLLVIDEQHKFGVKQRTLLTSTLNPPHTLTMTATPIPRTIGLTMLGNLNLSYIDQMPENRLPPKTFLVPPTKVLDCYGWIKNQILKKNTQAFIVCPFIEESDLGTVASAKAAATEFKYLSTQIFPDLKLGLIHGKTKPKDQQTIISEFQKNHINILVTTPIIEVGVDIPNANIMIIQSADRFGLAQLHQLRGRIGRGESQSYCYLFTESQNEKSLNRLKFIQRQHLGIKIAEFDLRLRGPGEIFSYIQHGFPSLKLANLNDYQLISRSQQILTDLVNHYPDFDLTALTTPNLPDSTISPPN